MKHVDAFFIIICMYGNYCTCDKEFNSKIINVRRTIQDDTASKIHV